MNVFNRMLAVIVLLALLALTVALSIIPEAVLQAAQNTLENAEQFLIDLALEPVAVAGDQRRLHLNRRRRRSLPFFLHPHTWQLSAHGFEAAAARLPRGASPGERRSASGSTAKTMEGAGQFGAFHPQTA